MLFPWWSYFIVITYKGQYFLHLWQWLNSWQIFICVRIWLTNSFLSGNIIIIVTSVLFVYISSEFLKKADDLFVIMLQNDWDTSRKSCEKLGNLVVSHTCWDKMRQDSGTWLVTQIFLSQYCKDGVMTKLNVSWI